MSKSNVVQEGFILRRVSQSLFITAYGISVAVVVEVVVSFLLKALAELDLCTFHHW